MQVNAAMNSYMLPHGVRCSASPRARIASTWPVTPTQVRLNANRSQKPDGHRLDAEPPAAEPPAEPPAADPAASGRTSAAAPAPPARSRSALPH